MEFVNYFDVIIIAIIIILSLKGIFSGFVREVCSVIGIIGGVLLASRYGVDFGLWINSIIKIQSQTLLNLIGFMLILAAVWILSLVLAEIILKFVKSVRLGKIDKFLGVFIAGVKVFLIISIILFTFSKMNFLSNFTEKLQQTSVCYPAMINIGGFIVKTDFATEIREKATQNINTQDINNGLKVINNAIKNKE